MTWRSNLAYQTAPKQQPEEKVIIRKAPGRGVNSIKPSVFISIILAIGILLGFSIFSMVKLNETTSQINTVQAQLREQQSENVRLSAELGSAMSLSNVATYAEQNLGLSKADSSQISYISIESGNRIEIPQQEEPTFLGKLTENISCFFAYLFH